MRITLVLVTMLLLAGCSRAWIDAGVCADTSKLPDIDVIGKALGKSDLVNYDPTKQTERCVKLNAGHKNLSKE
jgi:hypothetical protein